MEGGSDPPFSHDWLPGCRISSSLCGEGVDSALCGRKRFCGLVHHGGRCEVELCRDSSSSLHLLSGVLDNQGVSGRSGVGVCSGLAAERLCPGIPPTHSPTFFQDVLSPEGYFGQETHHRPFSVEYSPEEGTVQNGRFEEGCKVAFPRPLGSEAGSERCLPSPSPGTRDSEVFRLCPRGKDLRLPGSSVRALTSPLALHQGYETHQEGFTSVGSQDFFIPRRFPDFGSFPARGNCSHSPDNRSITTLRFPHKLEEISVDSPEAVRIFGGYARPRCHDLFSSGRESRESPVLGQDFGGDRCQESGPGVSHRLSGVCSLLPSSGSAVDQASTILDEFPLDSFRSSQSDCNRCNLPGGSSALGRQILPGNCCSHSVRLPRSGPDDRCLSVGLGRGGSSLPGPRGLGYRIEESFHELVRTQSYSSVPPAFLTSADGPLCLSKVRQHDGSRVYQETRIIDFSRSLVPFSGNSGFGLESQDLPCASALTRCSERPGRQGLEEFSNFDRVVSRRDLVSESLQQTGDSPGGFDGHFGECETVSLRLPLPRPESLGDRRLLLGLESLGLNLPVPTIPIVARSGSQTELLPGQRFYDCSSLAVSPLVSSSVLQVPSPTPTQRGPHSVPMDLPGGSIPSGGGQVPTTRLDFMKRSLLNDGFSMAAVDYFLSCHKSSTQSQYQSTWARFLAFLDSELVRPSEVRLYHVHNFLAKEALDKGKAYRTVATYKCALALPLKICWDLDLDNIHTRKFMMGVWNGNPPKPTPMPSWDLSELLVFIRSDLFEDLREVSFSLLTQKVLVLLLIASGRRISEIANLSRITSVVGNRTSIDWLPDFSVKWCSGFSGFVPDPPSFLRLSSDSDRHLRNCPVRALNIFLERRNLVVNNLDDDCFWTLSPTGLASAFRSVVRAALVHAGSSSEVRIYPHQTKKFAVSYCWKYFSSKCVKDKLPARTGNKSLKVLKGKYLGSVPDIKVHCVVPLGTISPTPSSLG